MALSREIIFVPTTSDSNLPRIGGASLLPPELDWPRNPNGQTLTMVAHLPAFFLNNTFGLQYPENTAVSVFSTYQPRSESDFIIPAHELTPGPVLDEKEAFTGSKIGGRSGLLQMEELGLENAVFGLQWYGGDFPAPFKDIFYLSDSVGYLFLSPCSTGPGAGIFFTQCT